MAIFHVIKAELVRAFIIMRRYWFATLTSLIVGYGMLIFLIVGFMARRDEVSESLGNRFGVDPESATNAALGFIIGMFAFGVVGVFTQGLQGMARTGELEQLCLSPFGLVTNFLGRSLVGAVMSALTSSLLLVLIATTVQGTLHARPGPTIVLLLLTYVNLLGFGFMVGGLVLVFKQTGQIASLLRMALLFLAFLVSEPVDTGVRALNWAIHFVPVIDASICLKYVLIKDQMTKALPDGTMEFQSVFTIPSFYFLVANCVLWTVLGIVLFRAMENWSRTKGTLGSY